MTDEERKAVKGFVENYYKYDLQKDENNNYTGDIERYIDYSEVFPKSDIGDILVSDSPREKFWETIDKWELDNDDWFYQDDFFDNFKTFCNEQKINEDEARVFVYDNFHFVYPDSFLNPNVDVVFQLDTGDGNYDFTKHNILNYAGSYGYTKGLEETAALHWLAKQQGRLGELQKAIKAEEEGEEYKTDSKFVKSSIQELQNITSHMGCVAFLVNMPLHDAINLKEELKSIQGKFDEFRPLETKGSPFGIVTLDKKTNCGIYDPWYGSGSVLEIELEKDVNIPLHLINNIWSDYKCPCGYTLESIYGLTRQCWQEGYKGFTDPKTDYTVLIKKELERQGEKKDPRRAMQTVCKSLNEVGITAFKDYLKRQGCNTKDGMVKFCEEKLGYKDSSLEFKNKTKSAKKNEPSHSR